IAELLDTIVDNDVKGICIVGEAFARPLLETLDAEPDRWDLGGLRVIFTSGAMMRNDTKTRLLHYAPRAQIIDSLGSSESGGLARAAATSDGAGETGAFRIGPGTRVIGDDGKDVVAGSGESGF